MSDTMLKPGEFKINLFELSSRYSDVKLDLSKLIYSLSLHEAVSMSSIRGNVSIIDSANILNRFDLSGQEIIEMVYEDAMENTQRLWLSLYAISDAKPNEQGTGMMYKLHFTSVQKFESDSRKISKSYSGTTSEIALAIYQEYFEIDKRFTKPFTFELTEGEQKLVIPNLLPSKAMEFLARRSYSSQSLSQTFRFWEDRNGYHLRTIEDLLRDAQTIQYTYNPLSKNDGEGLVQMMGQVIDVAFPSVADSYSAMVGGQYKRSVRELDVLEQNVIKTDLKYSEVFDDMFSIGDDRVAKYSPEFVEQFLESGDYTKTVIKDYSESDSVDGFGMRSKTFYPDVINHKGMMLDNVSESSMMIKVYGRNDIQIGSIIELNMFENDGQTTDRKIDKRLGGKYMVESIAHNFVEETFMQTISLVRNDWGQT